MLEETTAVLPNNATKRFITHFQFQNKIFQFIILYVQENELVNICYCLKYGIIEVLEVAGDNTFSLIITI